MDNRPNVNRRRRVIEFAKFENVSALMASTYQVHPKTDTDVFDLTQYGILYASGTQSNTLQSGSTVEFYIETLHSCIGDVDTMMISAEKMVFTEDIPALPDDFHVLVDSFHCLQMIPYPDYPGYVKLQRLGAMSYNWHNKKFIFQKTNALEYLPAKTNPFGIYPEEPKSLSPAAKTPLAKNDEVPCIWCTQWPKEAHNWPLRQRYHGWPTTDNMIKVVQSGCHVVFAKHPACRNDEHQMRLSFSVAEICLIQSWTPTQQIVYHMLRYFAKRELIMEDCPKEDEVLCNYHFKTLMLWGCEEIPAEWWNSSQVIELCCYLLRVLSEWLRRRYCPNYFIPEANLFYEHMKQNMIDETILSLYKFCNFDSLGVWFAVNYIKPIIEKVFTVKDNMEDVIDTGYWMLRICETMDDWKLTNFDVQFSSKFFDFFRMTLTEEVLECGYAIRFRVNFFCLSRDNNRMVFDQGLYLPTLEFKTRFPQFVKVLFMLCSANALEFKQTAYDSELLTKLIRDVSWQPKVVSSKYHHFPEPSKEKLSRRVVQFLKAQDLMENLTGLNSPHETKLLSQLCKGLLRNVICCDDFNSSIKNKAFVYMAALHFAESDYQSVILPC